MERKLSIFKLRTNYVATNFIKNNTFNKKYRYKIKKNKNTTFIELFENDLF